MGLRLSVGLLEDYKNKHKSKISYMIDKLGKDEFLKRLYLYIDKQRQNINLKINPKIV